MWNLESEMWNYFHITHQSLITKIMGFQRVCAPFGRVLRDSVPESLSAESEILNQTLAFGFLRPQALPEKRI